MWENGIFKADEYSELLDVSSHEAIEGMLILNRRCGVMAGPSSGANYQGALKILRETPRAGAPIRAVFFACDRVDPYLSYIKDRRPDIFGASTHRDPLSLLTEEELFEVPSLTPPEAQAWIRDVQPLIVDTRSPVSFNTGSLPGALNYPLEMLKAQCAAGVPFDRERPILLVCQRGVYTRPIAAYLRQRGLDARNLSSGLAGWRAEGLKMAEYQTAVPVSAHFHV